MGASGTRAVSVTVQVVLVMFGVYLGVVEIQANHQCVSNAEPDGKEDDLGKQMSPNCTNEVEQVSQEPDSYKSNGDAVGRFSAPLLN